MSNVRSFSVTLKASITEGQSLSCKTDNFDTVLDVDTYEVLDQVFEGETVFNLISSLLECSVKVLVWFRELDQQIEFKIKSKIFDSNIESKQIFRLKDDFKSLSFLLYNQDNGPQVHMTCINISKN
jgi:hypothetical protein